MIARDRLPSTEAQGTEWLYMVARDTKSLKMLTSGLQESLMNQSLAFQAKPRQNLQGVIANLSLFSKDLKDRDTLGCMIAQILLLSRYLPRWQPHILGKFKRQGKINMFECVFFIQHEHFPIVMLLVTFFGVQS